MPKAKKKPAVSVPCESNHLCLVPALKDNMERAEGFNQEYRKDVKITLEGIKENTDKMNVFLAEQGALKDRVVSVEDDVNKLFDIVRKEIIPALGKKIEVEALTELKKDLKDDITELKTDLKNDSAGFKRDVYRFVSIGLILATLFISGIGVLVNIFIK